MIEMTPPKVQMALEALRAVVAKERQLEKKKELLSAALMTLTKEEMNDYARESASWR
jgi:hypothetical protein